MADGAEKRTGSVVYLLPTESRKLALFAARMGFGKGRALEFLVQECLNDDGIYEPLTVEKPIRARGIGNGRNHDR